MRVALLAILLAVSASIASSQAQPTSEAPWLRQAQAKGQECPNGSRSYCPVQAPVCCRIKGNWRCFKQLSDCRE